MSASESVQPTVRFFSPFALFVGFLLVIAGYAWTVDFIPGGFGYEWRNSPLHHAVSAGTLILGGVVFAAICDAATRQEIASHPTLRDHGRRCSIFYAALIVLSVAVVQDQVASRTVVSYRQEVATPTIDWLLVLTLPVLIDSLVLLRQRWRSGRATLEGTA